MAKTAYIEVRDALRFPIDSDVQKACDGFEYAGYNIEGFNYLDILTGKLDSKAKYNPFVGCTQSMLTLFKRIGKSPTPIDYPSSVRESGLMNRDIQRMKSQEFVRILRERRKPMFVKPTGTKLFHGTVIESESQLSLLESRNCDVWVSNPINIVSEHRVFVYNKNVVYSCNYSRDFTKTPDFKYVNDLVEAYEEQPIAYTIDVGILRDGSTVVIEFNDFWSIGSYGLECIDYARMLLERYQEIVLD
jgi:hypothetical protein